RVAKRLADNGNNSLALFTRAFRDELFDPQTKRFELWIDHERELVASRVGTFADSHAQTQRVVKIRFKLQESSAFETHHRGWDHPEIRKRGVTPTNVWLVQKYARKPVALCRLNQRRSRVSDRDEVFTRLNPIVPELEEHVRLGRRPRLRRDHKQTLLSVDPFRKRRDHVRIGRIEHQQLR